MDITMIRNKLTAWVKKYRYVAIILVAGVALMLLPTDAKKDNASAVPPVPDQSQQITTEAQLEGILSQIKGAGKVKLLLTCATGERKVFQVDERSSFSENSKSVENKTVLVTDGNRTEGALVSQVMAPEYRGAVVVCQGAADPSVRFAISEAVSKATGLGTDRISVLVMK
jgi:stage III sporulation protein AG